MKMKLLVLEIPEELDRVPEWIEAHLMGLDLHQVVTELCVMRAGPEESVVTLEDVLGDKLEAVLQHGLRSLSQAQLRQLMGCPQLLVELQNLVLDEGGEYWATVPQSDEVAANTKKSWAKLQAASANDVPKSEIAPPTLPVRKAWLWAGAGWLAATAATVALFFVRADHVRQLEDRLAQQTLELNSLRNDLLAQQRILPADLPDSDERFVAATADPNDLPDDDPPDLPEF